MSNLNNLTSKILEDAKSKANSLIEEAKKEEAKIIEKKIREANEIKNSMIEKSKLEAVVREERILSSAQLKVRNEKLKAKGQIVEKVLTLSKEKLKNMTEESFKKFLVNYVAVMDIDGDEEIIVPDKYKNSVEDYIAEINNLISSKGKIGQLTLHKGERKVEEGFIVFKNGIENNVTFDNLISFRRDELEQEIVKMLF